MAYINTLILTHTGLFLIVISILLFFIAIYFDTVATRERNLSHKKIISGLSVISFTFALFSVISALLVEL
jgi:hypothetical protein